MNGSKIESIVSCRGEAHRYTVHLPYNRHAGSQDKTKKKRDTISLDYNVLHWDNLLLHWV